MGTSGPVRAFFMPLRWARAFFERRLCSRVEVKVPWLDGRAEDAAAGFNGSRDISREGKLKIANSGPLVPSRVMGKGMASGRLLPGSTARCGLSSSLAGCIFERSNLFADLLCDRLPLPASFRPPCVRLESVGDLVKLGSPNGSMSLFKSMIEVVCSIVDHICLSHL